jgi:small-conductance mechanosensitive channel
MGLFDDLFAALPDLLPFLAVLAAVALTLWVTYWLLQRRRAARAGEGRVAGQVVMLILTGIAVVLVVLVLPVTDETRGQLLTLLGIALTAVIALSSTTLAANLMAGLMLRAVRSFRPGDFIRVGEQFGRVTDRGLFHTEIQLEDRDLTTLPNLYLISNPVTVVRKSGTIVSATLSLGYDVPRSKVEPVLKKAAEQAELQDPFVQVTDLGDFSVSYRIAGFLPEVKQLLSTRSLLRKRVMDKLHAAGIEIVSPTYMNQRPLAAGHRSIPPVPESPPKPEEAPEPLIFDKADEAEEIVHLREEREQLSAEIKEIKSQINGATEPLRSRLERELASRRDRSETIEARLENVQQKDDR